MPNLNKEIKNPTIRWIFQIMEGVNIIQIYQENIVKPVKEIMTNLNTLRKKFISLFGKSACKMYSLEYV